VFIYIQICFCVENITQQKVGFDYVISITLRILTLSIKVGRKGYFMLCYERVSVGQTNRCDLIKTKTNALSLN
jgi:hypothetical protein